MRSAVVVGALLIASPVLAADHQLRPFLGTAFGGGTSFVDPDRAAGRPHLTIGLSHVTLGNIFGVDFDVADSPRFFQSSNEGGLVLSSRVSTFTGNFVIAAPRSKTEYGLRPYLVGGAGLMRVHLNDYFGSFENSRYLAAWDVGAGVVGFFTNRAGVSWEVRRFDSLDHNGKEEGLAIGAEQLSFWRASMAFVYRY